MLNPDNSNDTCINRTTIIQRLINIFYHPDFTVGTGISPVQSRFYLKTGVADFTAGREFHPAPKYLFYFSVKINNKVIENTVFVV